MVFTYLMIQILTSTVSQSNEQVTFVGDFRSVKGVMNQLSCYCFNSGYLKSSTRTLPICFSNQDTKTCAKMKISGVWVEKMSPAIKEPASVCSSESLKMLEVKSSQCL